MSIKTVKVFQAPEFSPLMLYHNLNIASSGILLYATNGGVAACNPITGRTTSFISLEVNDKISAIKSVLTQKDFIRTSVGIAAARSGAYVISEKGIVAKLPIVIERDGIPNTAAICIDPCSASSLRIVVGTSSGQIIFSGCKVDDVGHSMSSLSISRDHRAAVTAVTIDATNAGSGILAASGDASGNLILWDFEFKKKIEIPSANVDCVTDVIILVGGVRLAASYGSGKIRLFSSTGQCDAEVCAHSKWITALGYHAGTHQLASASEDCVLNLWSVNVDSDVPIAHKASASVPNGLPIGVALNSTGDAIFLSSYANPSIQMMSIN